MGTERNMPEDTRTEELASQLAARRYAGYGYGFPGQAGAGYPQGALAPHRSAYYGMTEHIAAEERMLEQRRTLYTALRSAEAKEASCVEKRLSDEQITATRPAEEHRIRAAEAKVTAEAAAQAAAALKRAEDANNRAQAAREAEFKAANEKAAEARDAEATLASSVAAEGQSMHERAGTEASCHHFAHAVPHYGGTGYGYGYPGYGGRGLYG